MSSYTKVLTLQLEYSLRVLDRQDVRYVLCDWSTAMIKLHMGIGLLSACMLSAVARSFDLPWETDSDDTGNIINYA